MSRHNIDKDVPAPERQQTGIGSNLKYPWPRMKSGDSILIAKLTESDSRKTPCQISAAMSAKAWLRRYRPGWHVLCEREGDAVRVWIMEDEE